MSDLAGDGPVGRSRPDDEPTINEAGTGGFVVDGTDSFAVPGPIDVVPVEEALEPPPVSRTRLLVTAGAVAAGLAFVVAVGRGGAGDAGSSLRSDGADAPGFTFSHWGADDSGTVVAVVPDPLDADTLRQLEDGQVVDEDGTTVRTATEYSYDDESTDDGYSYDDEYGSIPTYPGYDDDSSSYDDNFPTYRPSTNTTRRPTTPQRLPVVPRVTTPPVVVATTTTTEPEEETTTTPPAEETTTTPPPAEETTTTPATAAPTTPTTVAPSHVWAAASQGLPACPTGLHVWARGDGLVAAVGSTLYEQPLGGTWAALGAPDPAAGAIATLSASADPARFAVGGVNGVFTTTDDGAHFTKVGDVTGVRALAISPNGASLIAVTDPGGVQRWNGTAWDAPSSPPVATALGAVQFVDDSTALLGTNAGVFRSADAGATWASVSPSPVLGEPVRGPSSIYWLRAGGGGVLRSTALDGLSWEEVPSTGAEAPDAQALAVRLDQLLMWSGPADGGRLIASGDGGTSWSALEPTTPFRPDGLVHAGTGTFAFRVDCPPGGGDPVLRLPDP